MKRLCLLTILLTILLSGCSEFQRADSDARNTAKATLGQVLELKRQVRKKIAAEERYYCRTMQTVVDKRTRTQEVAFMRGTALAVDEEAMGIREDPNSLTAESLSTRLATHAESLVNRMESGIRPQDVREANERSLQGLRNAEHELTMLERTLLELTIPPDKRDRIARVNAFIITVAGYYRELERERESQPQ